MAETTDAPTVPPSESEGEHDWLFEYLMSVFKSPSWEIPLMMFIDDNCIMFDSDEENKLVYTQLHKTFCDMVEGLLESHLTEIGISPEDFVEICTRAAKAKRDVNMAVLEQILAVEDFLTFKKLMVRRNLELEAEALDALTRNDGALDDDGLEEGDIDSELAEAIRISREETAKAKAALEAARDAGEDVEEAQASLNVLEASLREFEAVRIATELEMAQIEQAIAASLMLEQERIRMLEELAEEVAAQEQQQQQQQQPTPEAVPTVTTVTETESTPIPVKTVTETEPVPAPTSVPVPVPVTEPTPQPQPVPKSEPKVEPTATPTPTTLPPIISGGGSGGGSELTNLSSLPDLISQAKVNKAKAQEAFAATKEARQDLAVTAQRTAKRVDEIDPEEMERRRAHLKAQRDLLLKKKKKEQESKLTAYQEKTLSAAKDGDSDAMREKVQVAVAGIVGVQSVEEQKIAEELAVEQKRMAMRLALGRQLKSQLLEQEAAKLTTSTATGVSVSSLDDKLSEVYKAREKARQDAEEAAKKVREAAMVRAKNIGSAS